MALSISNVFGSGSLPPSARNPLDSMLPSTARSLGGFGMLAAQFTGQHFADALPWSQARRTDSWLMSSITGTATFIPVTASDTEEQGFLRLGTGATTSDHGGSVEESYDGGTTARATMALRSDLLTVFRAQVRHNVATASAWLIGLADVDAVAWSSSAINLSDFVGFLKAKGGATIASTVRTSSTSTSHTESSAFAADTWYTVEIQIIGRSVINFWLDGVLYAQTTLTNMPANTVPMTPIIAVANGTSPGATARIDVRGLYCGQCDLPS